ncbi:cation:proton antiporter [Candidatus Woesearchaeota archaeon]|nr:cation:proton antiporter [Candidatus Woesearchaeota archaeon]MBW3016413.1 cation:proton antiporter [Candidatus Woesearchaeota archaeon]
MQDALIITTAIAVLLFVGVICSWMGNKLRIPDILLLILTGMFFGAIEYKNQPLIQFPTVFLTSVAILALAMIVFDSTARLPIRELDTFSLKAVKLTFVGTLFTLVFFTAAVHYIINLPFWVSLLLASIMTGTAPEAVLTFAGKSKVLTLLKLESLFNTPLTVILPFVVLDLMENITALQIAEVIEQAVPFIMKFIVGIGAGVFVGIVLFKIVQKSYVEVYSPLVVIIAALLAYVLAENLGGSGVLSVTALGLFFGNVYVKQKITLLGIESVMAKALYILVFMLTGIIIKIPFTKEFFIASGILFGTYTAIRFFACWISLRKEYKLGELIFMSLDAPKGVATAAVVFILTVYNIEGITTMIDMIFAFILYSIILASIVTWISHFYENSPTRH